MITKTSSDKKRRFFCDIETFSSADIKKTGVFKYTESEDFQIMLMSYCWDDEPMQIHDFVKDGTPDWLEDVLTDESIIKVAHNCLYHKLFLNFH